jgi:hypothetical protein
VLCLKPEEANGKVLNMDQLIADRPSFHRNETEVHRLFRPGESLLPDSTASN